MPGMQKYLWLLISVIGVATLVKILYMLLVRQTANPVKKLIRTVKGETGPMVYFARSCHGQADKEYQFNYKKYGRAWRAYILKTPGQAQRRLLHTYHYKGSSYICWDRPVYTLKEIQTISRAWADGIQEYNATGRWFA